MFQYTNRKGVTYHLHGHLGRGGKRRYTLKRSRDGAQAGLPPGYEVVENVNGQVSVRRARPRLITAEEEAEVQSGLTRLGLDSYRIEVKDRQITIFEPDCDPTEIAAKFHPLETMPAGIGEQLEAMVREQLGDAVMDQYLRERRQSLRQQLDETTHYSPVLRFRLADPKCRSFQVARMSYRSEGGWHQLDVMQLARAVKRYVRHLGKDSFFDLI